MPLSKSVRALLTAAYPWALVTVVMIFVWQTVAAHRAAAPLPPSDTSHELKCDTVTHGVTLGVLPEASGLALSGRTPGVLWSMNDSSLPEVVAIDQAGRVLGRVRLTGAEVNNWEDVSVAPCAGESCLYMADTGNGGGTQRNDVVVYRTREPGTSDTKSAPVEIYNAAYPADEDHEAEALFIAGGQLYLVTKGHPSVVFRFPRRMEPGTLATLERVGEVPTERFQQTTIRRQTRITDAESSPDGMWVAMRTNKQLLLYRAADIVASHFEKFWEFDLSSVDEPQGEGVAITNGGDVYLASEGGGHGLPGLLAHLKCTLPGAGS